MVLVDVQGGDELVFSEQFACVHCGVSLPEIEPRTFSFNSPHGACPACTGLGFKLEVDPDIVIPNKGLSLAEGAIIPWVRSGSSTGWYRSLIESVARAYGFSPRVPVKELPDWALNLLLYGNKGETVTMRHKTHMGRCIAGRPLLKGLFPTWSGAIKRPNRTISVARWSGTWRLDHVAPARVSVCGPKPGSPGLWRGCHGALRSDHR